MFHLTLPVAVAGILLAGGTAVTATVLYTSGPLSGSDKQPADAGVATVTATATASSTAVPAEPPTPGGTQGPCITVTGSSNTAIPCIPPPGTITAPPPPGVPGPNFTPPRPVLTTVVPPPGFQNTPTPTAVDPAVQRVIGTLTGLASVSQQMSRWLSITSGDFVRCTAPCVEETDPEQTWGFAARACGDRVPLAGYRVLGTAGWPTRYLQLDESLVAACAAIRSAAGDLPSRRALGKQLSSRLESSLKAATAPTDPTTFAAEIRAALGQQGTRP